LFFVSRGELVEDVFSTGQETHIHLSAVRSRLLPGHQLQIRETIEKFDRAMMPKLQPLGQLAYGYPVAAWKPFNGQQCLMLLRGQTRAFRGLFAETEELS
jgi:hypothetical protein